MPGCQSTNCGCTGSGSLSKQLIQKERAMHTTNNVEVSPTELTDEELSAVSAGKPDVFGDIKGESTEKGSHQDWISVLLSYGH
jgi:hypothetical protein